MNGRSVRFTAVIAVLAMVIAPVAAVSFDSIDSDAESVDYTKYYYNQLDKTGSGFVARWIYDAVMNADGTTYAFKTTINIDSDLQLTDRSKENVSKVIEEGLKKGVNALSIEQPLKIYWLSLSNKSEWVSTKTAGKDILKLELTVTFDKADYDTFGMKADADIELATKLSEISATLDKTDRTTAVTSIHDKLCTMLTYDSGEAGKSNEVRSVYTALVGTGHVVCEGYAKAFKALCDYNSIPCLLITGDAGTKSPYEPHMWNYVMLENGFWYLVDVTWDDQSSIMDDYLLVGSQTIIYGVKAIDSHNPERGSSSTVAGYGFTVPALSETSPLENSCVATYMSEGKEFKRVQVKKDSKMTAISETPKKEGYNFLRWCADAELKTPWDWNTIVTEDVTLYAEFTDLPCVSILQYDGDTQIGKISVIKGAATQLSALSDLQDTSAKKFVGWNTAKDGTGLYFTNSDTVNLTEDMVLYAVWENTEKDFITTVINDFNEFLAGDSIIDGVSNTVFSIVVSSAALILIAFILIRLKN